MNFEKLLRAPFLQNTSEWLLLGFVFSFFLNLDSVNISWKIQIVHERMNASKFFFSALLVCFFKELWLLTFTSIRSSYRRCSRRKAVFRISANFTGNRLCQTLFFNKVAGLSRQRCFQERFAKFLRSSFLQNTSKRLRLKVNILSIQALFLWNWLCLLLDPRFFQVLLPNNTFYNWRFYFNLFFDIWLFKWTLKCKGPE